MIIFTTEHVYTKFGCIWAYVRYDKIQFKTVVIVSLPWVVG